MPHNIREIVGQAFIAVHDGRSTDDVVIDPQLNANFLTECTRLSPEISQFDANWTLLNLRKSSSLGSVTTTSRRLQHKDYQHASQIAARLLEDRFQLTVDRILCDPSRRNQFDDIALSIAPDVSIYALRKSALGLRKSRRLRPEIVKRVASWDCEIFTFDAEDLLKDLNQIPRKPGIYLFRDHTGYLYIGEAGSLRVRVAKHLDHSDRKALAHYFWQQGISQIVVELHAFDPKSEARRQSARRAYESDLIEKRNPRFNIRL